MKKGPVIIILLTLLLGGCASNPSSTQAVQEQKHDDIKDPRDPFESFNRSMWDFNYDVLDHYILRPVTVVYVDYMPSFARTGLFNMALNLEEPSNSLNNLLQGKFEGSLLSLGRFALNTTVGLLGAIDVASEIGLDREEEQFGEVLGKYGAGTGPYLMLPGWGPTDIRNTGGDLVDNAYFPMEGLNFYFALLRTGIKALEERAALLSQEQQLEQAIDPYALVKDAYFQNQAFRVNDGALEITEEEEALEDDIDAFLDGL